LPVEVEHAKNFNIGKVHPISLLHALTASSHKAMCKTLHAVYQYGRNWPGLIKPRYVALVHLF